ncbi:tRNA wybutosine-synthesizing protein 2-like [Hondaea fermentalgiana]|uniref:tRNA wybutosine-synthesizing protein 2-like n=1 Tax=Hondaea fermentalgiana TaxID=2315210 RepID=A0A2R5GD32_9STRA|nr:tRNA wybutosine-synthesizing protein 2-like [Hondaea fermentalgiana]|eukprot:GBG26061.1 tRNA wybutosine-synthesizing protein 2-like [Hondaea fermentalgiana]
MAHELALETAYASLQHQKQQFDAYKRSILAELADVGTDAYSDKSPKGSLDAAIVELVRDINASRDYVTTSSCSGRVSLFYEGGSSSNTSASQDPLEHKEKSDLQTPQAPRKGQGRWLGVNHDRALSRQEVLDMLASVPPQQGGRAVLKHEPFVLHVQCRDERSAQALLRVAMDSGLRESGLSLGQKKIMLGIRTLSNVLEVPVLVDGRQILSEDALGVMCDVAAEKFRINCERRAAFHANVAAFLRNADSSPVPEYPRSDANGLRTSTRSLNPQQERQKERRRQKQASLSRALEWKEVGAGADLLQRWGHASVPLPDGSAALVFGGFGPCDGTSHERRNDLILVCRNTEENGSSFLCERLQAEGEPPLARIKHAACWLDASHALCISGGRQSPLKALSDLALFHYDQRRWVPVQTSGAWTPRWSHTMVTAGEHAIIFGGRDAKSVMSDTIMITIQDASAKVSLLECHGGASVVGRFGHSAVTTNQGDKMVIYGGYARVGENDDDEAVPTQHMLGDVQVLEISTRTWSTVCAHSPSSSRFSHGAVALDDDRMLVVGGVGIEYRDNGAKLLTLSTGQWDVVRSSETYGASWAPQAMQQKFSLIKLQQGSQLDLLSLGGGNLCFSFGFCFGKSSHADASWMLTHDFVPDALAIEASEAKVAKVCLEKAKLYDRSRKIVPYLHNGRAALMAIPVPQDAIARVEALIQDGQLGAANLVHCPAPPLKNGAAPAASTAAAAKAEGTSASAKSQKKTEKPKKSVPNKESQVKSKASDATIAGLGVSVAASACKLCKSALEQAGLYDKSRRVGKLASGMMGVPVRGSLEAATAALASVGVEPAETSSSMMLPCSPVPKQQVGSKKARAANGNSRRAGIKEQLRVWVEGLVTRSPSLELPSAEVMRSELPKRVEVLGDVAIVPREAFRTDQVWAPIIHAGEERVQDCLWAMIASLTGAKRVLLQRKIDIGVKRQSRATMVYPRQHPDTAVMVKQNGVTYWFDMERCMFSSGNISEKQRVAKFPCRDEVVVDMFAGIGYFTLPYLVKAGVAHLHACEWNADALAALRKNLALNSVEDRCTVYAGDCRVSVEKSLRGIADRVNLGLIPSSRPFWPTGVQALHETRGGWLHIHENVVRKECDAFVKDMLAEIQALLPEGWTAACNHVERVKSYSPHVDHIVADVRCGPIDELNAGELQGGASSQIASGELSRVLRVPRSDERDPLPVIRRPYPRSAQEAQEIMAMDRPVVLTGIPSWSSSFWKLEALQEFCASHTDTGNTKVSVHVADDAHLSFVNKSFRFQVTELQALLHAVAQNDAKPMYLRAVGPNPRKDRAHFWRDFAELAKASGLGQPDEFVDGDRAKIFSSVFRVASAGLQLWTHFDVMANVLYQLHGSKRVVLFRPEDVGCLDMRQSVSAVVDIDGQPSDSLFGQARVRAMEVHLEAGEALYIPALWPHNARAKTASVAVNVFWRSLDTSFYGAKDLYGNRDPLPAERALALVQEASDLLGAAQDNGNVLPWQFRQFYAHIAAGKLLQNA